MLRLLLLLVLVMLVGRSFWKLVDGIVEGATQGNSSPTAPQQSVQMVRDPVCGTFIVRDRAIAWSEGAKPVYFCSTNCREQYRTRIA